MEEKIIKSSEVEKQDFGSIRVQNLFSEDSYDKFSIAKVEIVGEQKVGLDTESDIAYYVLEGKGKFFLEDDEFNVEKEDLVFIPKNTKYKDEGNLILLAISVPKFNRNKMEYFE
ncbi:MAG: hypothetical protein ABIB79_03365 [archaeon]